MNGIHDMGGMDGFGPVRAEVNEPLFHADWEARVLAMTLAMAGWGRWSLDAARHARERIPPARYLNDSYYERWLDGLETLIQERGLVTAQELASGQPQGERLQPPLEAAGVAAMLRGGGPTARPLETAPRFRVGHRVRARNLHPAGHTRLPRYLRGRCGEVVLAHGGHVFPDSNAHFQGENPQHLYSVRFSARELWGPDAPVNDSVTADLWESYLESA